MPNKKEVGAGALFIWLHCSGEFSPDEMKGDLGEGKRGTRFSRSEDGICSIQGGIGPKIPQRYKNRAVLIKKEK